MTILLAFRNLFRNFRRTLAILLTIALGAGALFAFDGFIHGILNNYRDETVHSHYGYGQINTKDYRETVYQDPWNHWIKDYRALETFLLEQDEVEHIFPRVSFSALLSKGNVSVSGQGQGIDASKEAEFFYGLNVEEGETLSYQHQGIILGKGLAKALDVKPGDSVTVATPATNGTMSKVQLVVAGIFHTGNQDFDSRMFRMQLDEAQSLLKTRGVESVALGLKNYSDWEKIAGVVEEKFEELEAISFAKLDEVFYQHAIDWMKAQFHIVQIIILSIVLLGIFNSISTAILERKQEIGNLRANGESVFNVIALVLSEGAYLGLIGGVFGVGLTYIFLKCFLDKGILMPPGPGLTRQFYISFCFEWYMAALTLSLSLMSAIVASLIAGWKVAKMPIAKALRSI